MKNLKNQITLIIIKYSVHAFKCAKNLIIMSLLLIRIIIENFHRMYVFCYYLYMSNNILF